MKWLQHSIVQIDHKGIACQFTTGGVVFQGWIMPDGMGVIQEGGLMVEFPPETIATNHSEGLNLIRKAAGDRHFHRHAQDYMLSDEGSWAPQGAHWVKLCRVTLADIPGQLSIHVTFKSGTAELLRYYTEFQSDQHARTHGPVLPRTGRVADQLNAGEVVRTASGRLTSPFPKIDIGTDRKAGTTLKRIEQWLIQNALDEAQSRDDDFNVLQFKASLSKPQQADKDCAEHYLFSQQSAVVSSPLSVLVKAQIHVPVEL
jgi:hypothetical protein